MDDDQQFCLRWNNHQSTLISVFDTLLENQTLVDCTLAAEGKFLKAHKVVLSACSPYFATLLQEQYDKHPIFILKDVKFQELRAMMDYMYRGEVNISQDQLAALLKAAESLQIKGLSDNRSTGNINPAPKLDGAHQQHRNLNVGANVGIKIGGGYTLEQTKRTRLGPNALDVQEMSGSREGSSSPSRRRKKVRRRSIEASLADIQHDNSNSSLQQQSNVVISAPGISNVNPISAAASVLAAAQLPSGATPGTVVGTSQTVASSSSAAAAAAAANIAPGLVAAATQQMLTNVTKKTESVKGAASSEAMNTDELATGVSVDEQEQQQQTATKVDKHNHKYKATSGKDSTDIVEPKSEYDDDGNEGTVEDLTLDEEDMGIDDLDQNAGTSHVGEGSSQGYAPWQHERSQDDLLMTQQDAQQRDPQGTSNGYWTILETVPYTIEAAGNRSGTSTKTTIDSHHHIQKLNSQTVMGSRENVNDNVDMLSTATVLVEIPATTIGGNLQYTTLPATNNSTGEQQKQQLFQTGKLSNTTRHVPQIAIKTSENDSLENTFAKIPSVADLTCNIVEFQQEEDTFIRRDHQEENMLVQNDMELKTAKDKNHEEQVNMCQYDDMEKATSEQQDYQVRHQNMQQFICNVCGKSYKIKGSLKRHKNYECGVAPTLSCPACPHKCKYKSDLRKHMQQKHGGTNHMATIRNELILSN